MGPILMGEKNSACSFSEIAQLDITPHRNGVSGGLTFTLHDGRTATFLVETDEALTDSLRERGASVNLR
jgi:hypothetical protein